MLRTFRVGCALAILLTVTPCRADDRWRLSATAGVGVAYSQAYVSVGGALGCMLGFGFEVSVSGEYWFANTPSLFKLSPGLTWYAPLPLTPYLGGYYAHWFVSDAFPDVDALGVRGGLTFLRVGPLSIRGGLAYERRLSCPADCDAWRPEAMASFHF